MKLFKRQRGEAVEALEASAPPGGRVVKVGEAYALWLPDSWTMSEEGDSHRFIWHREENPQGGLRISTVEVRKQIDMLDVARQIYESMREDGEISEFVVEETADRTVASWKIVSQEPGIEGLTVTYHWKVIRKLKALVMSYSYNHAMEGSKEIEAELAEAKKIVLNSTPL